MKLPDFFVDPSLNSLRKRIGLKSDQFGNFFWDPDRADPETHRVLTEEGGSKIVIDDLKILPDGTLAYKNIRVFLYIRDMREHLPRYHLMNCSTVRTMRDNDRMNRYVNISAQDHNMFHVNVPTPKGINLQKIRLDVCQNCLAETAFDGFGRDMQRAAREKIVLEFDPKNFFTLYPRNLHVKTPRYSWENSPVDQYTRDFPAISLEMREKANWKCTECLKDFSDHRYRRFLHVHHMNSIRSDNRRENLRVLCIGCHAQEFNHSHLRNTPSYKQFSTIFEKSDGGSETWEKSIEWHGKRKGIPSSPRRKRRWQR